MPPVTARMFMSRFMLRGLMSLKYDDLLKQFDKSMWDGRRRSVVLPRLVPDDASISLFPAAPFCFLPVPLPPPEVLALPTSVSDR